MDQFSLEYNYTTYHPGGTVMSAAIDMNFHKHFIRMNRFIQPRKHRRNRAALQALKTLGYDMVRIRYALMALDDVNVAKLARDHGVAYGSFSNVLNGRRATETTRQLIATRLGLKVTELWPPADKHGAKA
jgi:lambda repressor-like predicted transcriptional regulator